MAAITRRSRGRQAAIRDARKERARKKLRAPARWNVRAPVKAMQADCRWRACRGALRESTLRDRLGFARRFADEQLTRTADLLFGVGDHFV
ncbi:hypothetical protein, partial [Paraburkholderia lycopersici]|uniref:hypothetical protein n=1 Tax=Paraburkholderia lycopersici TaxID=416944 RepID=UPI001C40AF56